MVSVHDPDEYLDAATGDDDRGKRLEDIVGAYRALAELRDAGKAAGVGVGAKNWKVIRELDGHCRFDWVMMANSFTIMNHPPDLVEFIDSLAERNIAVINSALTHGGFLGGGEFLDYRPIDANDPADADRLRWRETFVSLCSRHERSPYDVAVAFGISHPGVTSVALSTSQPQRVESMVAAATTGVPDEFWAALREERLIDPTYPYLK